MKKTLSFRHHLLATVVTILISKFLYVPHIIFYLPMEFQNENNVLIVFSLLMLDLASYIAIRSGFLAFKEEGKSHFFICMTSLFYIIIFNLFVMFFIHLDTVFINELVGSLVGSVGFSFIASALIVCVVSLFSPTYLEMDSTEKRQTSAEVTFKKPPFIGTAFAERSKILFLAFDALNLHADVLDVEDLHKIEKFKSDLIEAGSQYSTISERYKEKANSEIILMFKKIEKECDEMVSKIEESKMARLKKISYKYS